MSPVNLTTLGDLANGSVGDALPESLSSDDGGETGWAAFPDAIRRATPSETAAGYFTSTPCA